MPRQSEDTPESFEQSLRVERERLRIALASVGDAVISTDAAGHIIYLNPVAEDLTAWAEAEAVGRPLIEVFRTVDEQTWTSTENLDQLALANGRTTETAAATLLIAKTGIERPIQHSVAHLRDPAGNAMGAVLVFRDVSEARRAHELTARLASIVESSDDAIISKTLDGVIQSWNQGAERIFGYTSEEAVGRHITMLIPPELISEEDDILSRLRRGQRIDHFETIRLAKRGRRVEISVTVSPIKDSDGRIVGASKVGRDITERNRAARIVRESGKRQLFLIELTAATQALDSAEAMMAVTARLVVEHLGANRCAYGEVENESVAVITGEYRIGVPTTIGRWPLANFGPEFVAKMRAGQPFIVSDVEKEVQDAAHRAAYLARGTHAFITVPLYKRGRLTAILVVQQATPRAWTAADVELVQAVVQRCWESVERARVSRGLREAAERLTLALQSARLGDWSWDVATDIVTLSERAAEVFGIAPGPQMTWTELQSLLAEGDREIARAEVERSIQRRDMYDVEYRVHRPQGDVVWVSAKGHAQYGEDGVPLGMLGVVQDITEKKRLEHELRERAELLADADRKKDEFIALLAHELRNPLAPVRTGLQLMRAAANDPDAVERTRAVMERQISHMTRLIDDLLDVSRLNRDKLRLQKTTLALADVVAQAHELVRHAIQAAGHELTISLPQERVLLDADLTRLAQVFGNLLANSAKYTNPGGRIRLGAALEGSELVVRVEDNGIGISPDAIGTVFEMFSQVEHTPDQVKEGLGIGLALVRGLVESHGGSVAAFSEGLGKGSTFVVRLPYLASDMATEVVEAPERELSLERKGITVVVADDNEDGAETLAMLLESIGCKVHIARDGAAAVKVVETTRPDLVLMDVGMPDVDGLEATRRIRAQAWGQAPTIIALTGWGQESDRQKSRDAGCDGHLVKPVDMGEIQKILVNLTEAK